jgi:hypothetical protein
MKVIQRYQTAARRLARMAGPALAGLLLAWAASLPARAADVNYKIQRILKFGDRAGDVNVKPTANGIIVDRLNDRGQILLVTFTAENPNGAAILRYGDGQFTPIAVAGRDGPLGVWPNDLVGHAPHHMNEAGDIVFTAVRYNSGQELGTFLWDTQTQHATPIQVKGTPATGTLVFDGSTASPVINNHGEIAFAGFGQDRPNHFWNGVFLRGADGHLQAIALTDQVMNDGRKLDYAYRPSLNDAGRYCQVLWIEFDKRLPP